jgi:hypothetical protein
MNHGGSFPGQDLQFWSDGGWLSRFNYGIACSAARLFGTTPVMPPVGYLGWKKWRLLPVQLSEIGRILGLDAFTISTLGRHQRRLYWRMIVGMLFYLVAITVILIVSAVAISFIHSDVSDVPLSVFIFPVVAFLGLAVFSRLGFSLVDRKFADSLCAMVAIFLLIDLRRDDALDIPLHRKRLLQRLEDLARNTRLLALRYRIYDPRSQDWIGRHCEALEFDVRERQRWIAAPKAETLSDLRTHFAELAPIFLTGSYGMFIWPREMPTKVAESGDDLLSRAFKGIGFGLPTVGLTILVWNHKLLENLNVSTNVVSMVLVAWILVAIDAFFRLGVVANVISLLKGVKEAK